MVMLKFVLS